MPLFFPSSYLSPLLVGVTDSHEEGHWFCQIVIPSDDHVMDPAQIVPQTHPGSCLETTPPLSSWTGNTHDGEALIFFSDLVWDLHYPYLVSPLSIHGWHFIVNCWLPGDWSLRSSASCFRIRLWNGILVSIGYSKLSRTHWQVSVRKISNPIRD